MIQPGTASLLFHISCLVGVASSGIFVPFGHLFPKANNGCPTVQERYKNLFVSDSSIYSLQANRQFQETFKIGRIRGQFPFPGTCDKVNEYSPQTLTTCDAHPRNNGRRQSRAVAPCCKTELSITIPQTVTSLYSGAQTEVIHLDSSYQLLHEGKCATPNAMCSTGRCKLAYRIQWVLVEQKGEQTFVPVSVGNHCYCSYQ